jgi:hypothetical protein
MKTIKHHNNQLLKRIITLCIFVFFITGCSMPGLSSSQNLNSENATNLSSSIQFILELPFPLEDDEKISIELLDEVTGFPHNTLQMEMIKGTNTEFHLTISFPTGSVIKYRYIKTGAHNTPESKFDGTPVGSRFAYADGDLTIRDILNQWYGEDIPKENGIFSGKVLDQSTGLPIPDILVNIGGQTTFTDLTGAFRLGGLTPGVNNVVFYATDGAYKTLQQGALISKNKITSAQIELTSMPLVNVTFNVTTPQDAVGAPVFLVTNLSQFGNQFSDLEGASSIINNKMPQLNNNQDNTVSIKLELHADTDLRYKFSLGDGYWNAEQELSGGFKVRQLIVPNHDIQLDLKIDSWGMPDIKPITFQVTIPYEIRSGQTPYIQFKTNTWTNPLPLWPLGEGNYLYILFSPLEENTTLEYRFCIDQNCQSIMVWENATTKSQIQAGGTPTIRITSIENLSTGLQYDNVQVIENFIPNKGTNYTAALEFTPFFPEQWNANINDIVEKPISLGANTIIFSPYWIGHPDFPVFSPFPGHTLFNNELSALIKKPVDTNLSYALYPKIIFESESGGNWSDTPKQPIWWDTWFSNYRDFALNYAILAEINQLDRLVIGGKSTLPAIPGGYYANGTPTDIPDNFNQYWEELISDIRGSFSGSLVWATNAGFEIDPLPEFIDLFDEIYITIDSPLSKSTSPTSDEIAYYFTYYIDNFIYEVYRSNQKPIILGFGYPSIDGGSMGCTVLSEDCKNDGLFTAHEMADYNLDFEEQALIYNAIFPVATSREWISGICFIGFNPFAYDQEGTSDINHKPAQEIIKYWFFGLQEN